MPLFLGIHKFPAMDSIDGSVDENWEKYKQAASDMGLKPLKVLIGFKEGVAYCQTEADSKEQVEEAHNKAEIPFEEIIEVKDLD